MEETDIRFQPQAQSSGHSHSSYRDSQTLRFRKQARFSRFGTIETARHAGDDQYPTDDRSTFFARGRDFQSITVNHKYTLEERLVLSAYESLDYLPCHSVVYKDWLKRQPMRLEWDRWLMMGMIGFTVGLLGWFLHQLVDVISDLKWHRAQTYVMANDMLVAWGFTCGYSVLFVAFGSILVVFFRPSASGSGLPELIGFLNGTLVQHIFNLKTMVVKFVSCVCVVGAGMPVGPEGPMIHLGSLVGAGLSQFRSDTLKFNLPLFERFRTSEDRRNFISAGAAAGVASAFGAPVGGLLFSMEEVSSFWNNKLSWQIFFCAMVSAFTTDLFNSAFEGFHYTGQFGKFKPNKYILFQVQTGLAINVLTFFPAVILGVLGGSLGAIFTIINLKITRARKRLLTRFWSTRKQKALRLAEPILIMLIFSTVTVFLPELFPCTPKTCIVKYNDTDSHGHVKENCLNSTYDTLHVKSDVEAYNCPVGIVEKRGNYTFTNSTYNELATLMFATGEKAIHQLFSRSTHLQFNYASLCTMLVVYFLLACWAAGTSISSGLVVPMLLIGALYGRILGRAMVDIFGIDTDPNSYWNWIDPGAFALIGAASFFGGVSRLTVSLSVIMLEITNDVQFLLPIMLSVMVAKWVGDQITHPLYHALLELKCIPFLDAEPVICRDEKTINLELFTAKDIMTVNPKVLHTKESVRQLAGLMLSNNHGGFPVVKFHPSGKSTFFGYITRMELLVLLQNETLFYNMMDVGADEHIPLIPYQQMSVDMLSDPDLMEETLIQYCTDETYQELFINLEPYVNQSAVSVASKFSLHRSYIIFRTLGLRHMTVTDNENRVMGIITRKDLMGFNMEEKLGRKMDQEMEDIAAGIDEAYDEDQESLNAHHGPNAHPPASIPPPFETLLSMSDIEGSNISNIPSTVVAQGASNRHPSPPVVSAQGQSSLGLPRARERQMKES